jgi:hypothetical protein
MLWFLHGQLFWKNPICDMKMIKLFTHGSKCYKFHTCYKSIIFQIYVLSNTILQILFLHKYILKYDFFNNWLLYVLGCTIICKSILKVLFILTWLKFENIKSQKKKQYLWQHKCVPHIELSCLRTKTYASRSTNM